VPHGWGAFIALSSDVKDIALFSDCDNPAVSQHADIPDPTFDFRKDRLV